MFGHFCEVAPVSLSLPDNSDEWDAIECDRYAIPQGLRITGKVAESFGVCTLEAKVIEKVKFVIVS